MSFATPSGGSYPLGAPPSAEDRRHARHLARASTVALRRQSGETHLRGLSRVFGHWMAAEGRAIEREPLDLRAGLRWPPRISLLLEWRGLRQAKYRVVIEVRARYLLLDTASQRCGPQGGT